jgi:hypothetical protein
MKKGTAGFDPIAKYTVADSKIWAQPVLLGGQLLLRAATSLTLWAFD